MIGRTLRDGFEVPFLYDTTITFPKGVHVTAISRGGRLGADDAAVGAAAGAVAAAVEKEVVTAPAR